MKEVTPFFFYSCENGFETWASIARLTIRKMSCPNGSRKLHFVQKIKLIAVISALQAGWIYTKSTLQIYSFSSFIPNFCYIKSSGSARNMRFSVMPM